MSAVIYSRSSCHGDSSSRRSAYALLPIDGPARLLLPLLLPLLLLLLLLLPNSVSAGGVLSGRVGPGLASILPDLTAVDEPDQSGQAAIAAAAFAGTPGAVVPATSPVDSLLGPLNASAGDTVRPFSASSGGGSRPAPADVTLSSSTPGCHAVAFTAAKVNYRRRKAGNRGTQVVFDRVITSVGRGWDSENSLFRCFCPGLYYFTFHTLSPSQGRARVDLMRNSSRIVSSEANYGGFDSGANSAVLRLGWGDIIFLWLAEGFLYENDARFRGYNSLSGYKIS